MCGEELGKDLRGVESLQRRHQDMIRDISAIEDKLKVSHKALYGVLEFIGHRRILMMIYS